jgi:ABC-2 type transport system permease protein
MVRKDLLRQARSPLAVLLTLAFPVVFSLLLGLTFGTGDVAPPRVPLLIEDRDDTMLSRFLAGAFSNERARDFFDARAVGPEGLELLRDGEASALLRIPEGFSERLLDGEPVTLELVRNPSESILPEIAEQTMTVLADGLDSASRLLRGPLDRLAPLLRDGGADPGSAGVAELSVAFYEAVEGAERYILPPVITLSTRREEEDPAGEESGGSSPPGSGFSVFLFMFPGISVWALFMIADAAMRDLLSEAGAGTLRRQLCGPVPPWMLVAGKTLYAATLAGAGLIVLSIVGAIAVRDPVDLPGFLLLSAAVVAASTGFAAMVYGAARTPAQGATLSSIVLIVCAFLGGAFLPLGSLPPVLRAVAPFSPFYWATTGFQAILSQSAAWRDVLPHTGILAGLGAVFLAGGSALLGRKVRRGEAA